MPNAPPRSPPSMPVWALATIDRLLTNRATALDRLWADPGQLMRLAGMTPDPWQIDLLRSPLARLLVLCSRQSGKSETAAALALHSVLLQPGALVLLLSPSERQSGELAVKVARLFDCAAAAGLALPAVRRSALQLHLQNGSRIVALPDNEATVRGYSGVALLVVDEAARVADSLYATIRPMLAVSRGRLLALSTPFGKRGWFYDEWSKPERHWQRIRLTAAECPRITPEFLAEERVALGDRWYRQEYECSFEDNAAALFAYEDLMAACKNDLKPFPLPE